MGNYSLPKVILLDLPTYPKGVLPLSLVAVAACFKNKVDVQIIDLNIEAFKTENIDFKNTAFVGLKVSSQNSPIAISITNQIKKSNPTTTVLWGGEFPSLLPDVCLEYADAIVSGLFEPIVEELIADLARNNLKKIYKGENNFDLSTLPTPNFSVVKQLDSYSSFMGLPMETSRGCTEKCVFCMVHVMQKKNYFLKSIPQLQQEIDSYEDRFINIIDYNFGVDKNHVIAVSEIIRKSKALGWMAEMCIELLDDDELLQKMSDSRCRMIYCGLESIDDLALQSVHKMNTNHVENYERIIRKAQSYGIQIAAGVILGIANTNETTFQRTFDFFQRMGIIYAKLTFLTYNPGTKVQQYMKKNGTYVTDRNEEYDGVRLSYLPTGVSKEVVFEGATFFIHKFYSASSILKRSFNTNLNWLGKMEFILFSYCYSTLYKEWMANNIFYEPERFNNLLLKPFNKSSSVKIAEHLLKLTRKLRYKK